MNQTVSAVWDLTDITYVLRGTVILDGAYGFDSFFNGYQRYNTRRCPISTSYMAVPNPFLSLTIESALPGTLLADGTTIPSPGQSVVVKLLSDEYRNGAGSLAHETARRASGRTRMPGRDSSSASMTASTLPQAR